ncbi:MAG: lyase family protein, partial [Mariprofundaceae bacterium]|nr:lyase family protein [Mariprofundaceae bacterium]
MSEKRSNEGSEKLWGGRFESPTDEFVEAFNASTDIDARMYAEDIAGSKAHAKMLCAQGILSSEDLNIILCGLDDVQDEIESGEF